MALQYKHIFLMVTLSLLFPFLAGYSLNFIQYKFVSLPIHSLLESVGAVMAFALATIIIRAGTKKLFYTHFHWTSIALISMGIFDLFHAMMDPGELFVWLHSIAVLTGGLLFVLVWLPEKKVSKKLYFNLPLFIAAISILISFISILFASLVPTMLIDGKFSDTSIMINIIGGLGFIVAALNFIIRYIKHNNKEDLLFAGHTLLFGVSGLLFATSSLWDLSWWLWHILRFFAYLIALHYTYLLFTKSYDRVEEQNIQLDLLNSNYQEIYENSPIAYLTLDIKNAKILGCNKAAELLLLGSKEQIIGLSPSDLSPKFQPNGELSSKDVPQRIAKLLQEEHLEFEWVHRKLDGSTFWAQVSLTLGFIQKKRVILAAWKDISENKNLHNTLQDSEQRWKFAVEGNGDGLWEWKIVENSVYFSKRWKEMIGFSEEELADNFMEWEQRVHPDDLENAYLDLNNHLEGKTEFFVNESRLRCKDGTYKWILSRGVIVARDDEGKPLRLIGTHSDIDNKKRLETDLQDAKERAEHATKAKTEFLANMSHEIRTPMNSVLGFLEQLAKGEKDPQRIKMFDTIKNSGEQLLNIINDILDFSKIDSNMMDIESHPYENKKLFETSANIFSQVASKKDIELELNYDNHLPLCLIGDQTRLQQILYNLLSNAIKFTHSKGKIILQASFNEEHKTMLVSVEDNGIGIADNKLATIFDSFSQEDISTTRTYGGTGLGLTISSRLVQLMGSELKVQSTVGKGSKFYFELTLKECDPSTLETTNTKDPHQEARSYEGHILIVEDNKTNQMLLSMILEDLGLSYDIANDGVEAIEKFKSSQYSIILMDENMPNMNGIESTKHIRNLEEKNSLKHTPIIAVTANALSGDRERFIDAKMDDYVAKPYSEEDILKVLDKYIA